MVKCHIKEAIDLVVGEVVNCIGYQKIKSIDIVYYKDWAGGYPRHEISVEFTDGGGYTYFGHNRVLVVENPECLNKSYGSAFA